MNKNKSSDRALNWAIGNTWRRMHYAHQVSHVARRALLIFGISAAILLPLASQQSPPIQQNIITSPKTFVEFPKDAITLEPQVDVVVDLAFDEVKLVSIPPISKQWHRARFNRLGDTFWAIPSLDFELKYTKNVSKFCTRSQCDVQLTFRGASFNLDRKILRILEPPSAPLDPMLKVNTPDCRPIRPDHNYYLECIVYKPDSSTTEDVCVHFRRSDVIEKTNDDETAALDIRWSYWRDLRSMNPVNARTEIVRRDNPADMTDAPEDPIWFEPLCKFPKL